MSNAAKKLHQRKRLPVLIKNDISKAFDSLSWEFLLDVLRNRGFGRRWCSWICGLLSSASSSVLINGELSAPFALDQGVRQGDPVSPAFFIIAMDTLQAMLLWAAQRGLLSPLGLNTNTPRASLFADDAVLFFRPTPVDNQVIAGMLDLFGEASGLHINYRKSKAILTPTSTGGGEGGGVWARVDDEEANAFPLAATASAAFLVTAALNWRSDAP